MKKDIHYNQDILFNNILEMGYTFFTGVPDSLLKVFINNIKKCDNIVATNESQAIGLAVGAELAGKKSCVYMQNSGIGNIINPLTSLCIPFDISPLIVIGHRHTLPQHKIMGEIDDKIMDIIGYKNYIIVYGNNNVK